MAATNFTPISLYYSTTASAVPTAANLVPGELAINTNDGKLYYEDSSGVVQTLASKAGALGDVVGPASATDNALARFDLTTGKLIQNSVGILSDAGVLTGLTGLTSSGSITLSSLTSGRVTYAGASGLLTDSATLTYDGTTLTATTGANFVTTSGNVNIGTTVNNVFDQVGGARPLLVQRSDTSTTLGGSTASITISNGATTTSNTAQLNFAAITGASTSQYSSAVISAIFGARTNGQYPTGELAFLTSSTLNAAPSEKMRIDSSGNVGIGTTSPRAKLDVSGSILVGTYQTSTNYASLSVKASSTITTPSTFTNAINIWNGTNTNEYSNITFGYNTTGLTNAPAYMGFLSTSGTNLGKGDLVFGTRDVTTDTAATERMRISSAGIVTMSAYGAGAATFSAAGVISSVSDETWKIKDGVPVNTDAMLQKLEPGYWFYNEEKAPTFGEERQLGFYAQNVHEAIGEEAAPTPQEGKPWGYYDRSVLAIAVMSLKNALNTIEELKQRIETLENK